LSQLDPGPPSAWDPFARVPHRLATSTAPRELRERAGSVVTAVAAATPALDPAEFVFAHGDISTGNVLGTPDHRVWLIDFDSAGRRPCGWDLACLDVDLWLEAGNDEAMAAVREGWRSESELPVSPCGLALVKATMATTFALTLDATPDRCKAIDARLSAVLIWAQDGTAPARLATLD
jgi:thiamine kinase-like enzyme